MKSPTTCDIARLVGVNQSTVSRALNGVRGISPATLAAIHRACKRLGYVPNTQARGFRLQRTRTLAVHIPFGSEATLADPFVPLFLDGVSREALARGYAVVLSHEDKDGALLDFTAMVKSRRADGLVILAPQHHDPRLKAAIRADIPCVLGRYDGCLGPRMTVVDVDNERAGMEATRFLVKRGMRRIGLICEPEGNLNGRDFERGFIRCMTEAGVEPGDGLIKRVPVALPAAERAARELLAVTPAPEAMIANTMLTVFGALAAVRGLARPPVILGVDSSLLRCLYPELPRILSPVRELGRAMAATLIDILRSGIPPANSSMLQARIVERAGEPGLPLDG